MDDVTPEMIPGLYAVFQYGPSHERHGEWYVIFSFRFPSRGLGYRLTSDRIPLCTRHLPRAEYLVNRVLKRRWGAHAKGLTTYMTDLRGQRVEAFRATL